MCAVRPDTPWFWQLSATAATPAMGRLTQAATVRQTATTPAEGQGLRVFGSYAVVYLQAGTGRYRDETGAQQPLRPGDMIFVSPRIGHAYGPDRGDWVQTYLVFDGPVFERWQQDGWFVPDQPVQHLGCDAGWPARLRRVVFGPSDPSRSDPDPLRQVCRLLTLLAELPRPQTNQTPRGTPAPPWVAEAARRLNSRLGEPLDLPCLARSLHVSYTTFRRGFTQAYGLSPARYPAARTLDHARDLMRHTDLTDQQIAHRLGFSDPQHFSKRFKQLVGRTPSQFRASLCVR